MDPFVQHKGIVVPLDRINVDTDAIMPKEFIKRVDRTGYGQFLFYYWRYLPNGNENTDFILNQEPYRKATILLARKNFGCGSSREHAPWGLQDYGFKVLIAPSFGDIFYNNCLKIGLLPVVLNNNEVEELFHLTMENKGLKLTVDLQEMKIGTEYGHQYNFNLDAFAREKLLKGLDDIAITQTRDQFIKIYEQKHKVFFRIP